MNKRYNATIGWRHSGPGGITCDRDNETITNLRDIITKIHREHFLDYVQLDYREAVIHPERIAESNTALIHSIHVPNRELRLPNVDASPT